MGTVNDDVDGLVEPLQSFHEVPAVDLDDRYHAVHVDELSNKDAIFF